MLLWFSIHHKGDHHVCSRKFQSPPLLNVHNESPPRINGSLHFISSKFSSAWNTLPMHNSLRFHWIQLTAMYPTIECCSGFAFKESLCTNGSFYFIFLSLFATPTQLAQSPVSRTSQSFSFAPLERCFRVITRFTQIRNSVRHTWQSANAQFEQLRNMRFIMVSNWAKSVIVAEYPIYMNDYKHSLPSRKHYPTGLHPFLPCCID